MPRDLLSGREKRQPIDLLADISPMEQPMQQSIPEQMEQTNPDSYGLRILGNVASGMAQGGRALRNAPYNITHAIAPEMAENIANSGWAGKHLFAPDTRELYKFGINDPRILDRLIQGSASGIPLAAATGGGSLLGMMRGGALAGGLLDEETPFLGAAVGGGLGAAGKGIPKLLDFAKNMRPQKVANEFASKYGAKGLEEIEAPSKAMWEKALAPKENIYETINPNTRLTTPAQSKYVNKIGNESEYAHLRDLFAQDPTLKNTHNLQSAVGEEIGELLKKKSIEKVLPQADRVRLHELKGIRDDLLKDINVYLDKVNPELKQTYNEASKLHREIVVPARNAAKIQSKIPRNTNETINKERLASALENASTPEKLGTIEKRGYRPLPEEVLTLRKQLEQNMKNKKKIFNPWNAVYGAGALGVPYGASHLLRHLLPNR